jgi:hypothetical protein
VTARFRAERRLHANETGLVACGHCIRSIDLADGSLPVVAGVVQQAKIGHGQSEQRTEYEDSWGFGNKSMSTASH